MREKKLQLEIEKLLLDNDIILNPLSLQIASSWMATHLSNVTDEFVLHYIKIYKEINKVLERIPNYYQAGLEIGNSQKRK